MMALTELFYSTAKEIMDKNEVSHVARLEFFANTIGHKKLFDIKQPGKGFNIKEIGKYSVFNGNEYLWTDYGNINFGVAAKAFGLSLEEVKFGAGFQQVFGDGEGKPDWGNLDGYFDEKRDTEMIIKGYNMIMPWD